MGCGCGKARQVIAATRTRDALAAGPQVPEIDPSCPDKAAHAEAVALLTGRVLRRPGLVLNRRLGCGCRVTVR